MKTSTWHRYFSLITISVLLIGTLQGAAITYDLGDRLGDNLACYCHARWIAYKLNIPFFYKSFKFSEYLALSNIHTKRDDGVFKEVMRLPFNGGRHLAIESLAINKNANILYVIPFFPELRIDAIRMGFSYFDVGWNDQKFIELLRAEIKPIVAFPSLELPSDRITVAVHLRKGSGPDGIKNRLEDFPLRFLPDSFFVEQIKRLSQELKDQPLYVYFFTDSKNPLAFVEKYTKEINKPNITYTCCQASHPDSFLHELEDFFNLTLFDYIIRPESHFSQIASKLSHAKAIVYPTVNLKKFKKKKKKHKSYAIYPVIERRG